MMALVGELGPRFGIDPVCRTIGLAPSTYYGWLAQDRDPSQRRRTDAALVEEIGKVHARSDGTYGSPRVHAALARQGHRIGRKRVERLMREEGLQGAFLRKRWRMSSTKQDPRATLAPDLLNRDFTAPAPDRVWVADATRIPCAEGVFWLAAIRDLFSNRIVGWRTSDRCDTDLVLGAFEYAVWTRQVRDQQLIHHSDRGCTYTALRFSQRLADHGVAASMGSVGDSYDNAAMENFFSTLKTELVYRSSWRTRDQAENALFAYIDGWYNTERIQARLGWLSPDEFERAWHHAQTEPATPAGHLASTPS